MDPKSKQVWLSDEIKSKPKLIRRAREGHYIPVNGKVCKKTLQSQTFMQQT